MSDGRLHDIIHGHECAADADILEQLRAALTVLGSHERALVTGASHDAAAQRLLNEILIDVPQVLHPAMTIKANFHHTHGWMPLAQAIAATPRARFPMVGDRGVGRERLTAWVREVSVTLGLRTAQSTHEGNEQTNKFTPFQVICAQFNCLAEKLASVEGLRSVAPAHAGRPCDFFNPYAPVNNEHMWREPLLSRVADATVYAAGLTTKPACPAFLLAFGNAGHLARPEVCSAVGAKGLKAIFDEIGGKVTQSLEWRLRTFVDALTTSGAVASRAAAASLLCTSVSLNEVVDPSLNDVITFVTVVRELGASFGTAELKAATGDSIRLQTRTIHEIWAQGIAAADTADAMRATIALQAGATVAAAPALRRRGV